MVEVGEMDIDKVDKFDIDGGVEMAMI
jgi:hypothetical protein